jgi:hypothetical protein
MRRQVWGEDGNCTQQTYRVFGHSGMVFLHTGTGVNQTGVNRAPEWKDGFDNARHKRTLPAVSSRPLFGS